MGAAGRKRQRKIRQRVIDRDGPVCIYCNKILADELITMDHIIPDSQNGTFNATNLTIACQPCNNKRKAEPFFEYIKHFNFAQDKIKKYEKLCANNLRIKVLNIAKEYCIFNDYEIPQNIIRRACEFLKIAELNYEEFVVELRCNYSKIGYNFMPVLFQEYQKKNDIIFTFDLLIHFIEDKSC